jgi:hypothetical protein
MARPNATPRAMDTLKDNKKMPIPLNTVDTNTSVPWNWDRVLIARAFSNFHQYLEVQVGLTYSYMTILTASFRRLSPKMMEYSLGSTLYWLKIARMVTGSVADKVDPKIRHSRRPSSSDSRPRNEYM